MSGAFGAIFVRGPQRIDLLALLDALRRAAPPGELSTRRWRALLTAPRDGDLLMIRLYRRDPGVSEDQDFGKVTHHALADAERAPALVAAALGQPAWGLSYYADALAWAVDERGELRWETHPDDDGGPQLAGELGADLEWLLHEMPFLPALSIPLAARDVDAGLLAQYLEAGTSMRVAAPAPPPRQRVIPKAPARRKCVDEYVRPIARALLYTVPEATSIVFAVGPYFEGYEKLPSCPSPIFARAGVLVPYVIACAEEEPRWPEHAFREHNALAHEDGEPTIASLSIQRSPLRIAHKGLSFQRGSAPKWVARASSFAVFEPWIRDVRVEALPAGIGPLVGFRPYCVAREGGIALFGPE
jgi:hypothetical protein